MTNLKNILILEEGRCEDPCIKDLFKNHYRTVLLCDLVLIEQKDSYEVIRNRHGNVGEFSKHLLGRFLSDPTEIPTTPL